VRTRIGGAALVGAILLAMGPGAGSPAAATTKTWTVRPGGPVAANAAKTTLSDTKLNSTLTCTSATMTGTFKAGGGLPSAGIGSITAAAFRCPSLLPVKLTALGLPWRLNLSTYDLRSGVARGTISHLRLSFVGPACTAQVNGTSSTASNGVVAVSHSDRTGKLTILPAGGNLHWFHVKGCDTLFGNGDPATLAAAYAVSPPQVITSP
jgi:hypothetical protein